MSDDDDALRSHFVQRAVDGVESAAIRASLRARMFGVAAEIAHIGRFVVRRRLGAGAMGKVYHVHDPTLGHDLALKVLARDDLRSRVELKREFRAAAELVHPNLVELYELFVDERVYYTMELVDGEPLTARRDRDAATVRGHMVQLASALLALHDRGQLHLDVKPSNVLVTPAQRVVLLDFGLTRTLGGDPLAPDRAELAGTPLYMAPEQMRAAAVSAASDWYAFGGVLYELLCGHAPIVAARVDELWAAKHRGIAAPPGAVDPELAALALALLDPLPERRPSGRAVLRALGGADVVTVQPAPEAATFVGRSDELTRLHAAHAAVLREGRPRTVTIVGDAGLGKTALVRRFAAHVADAAGCVVLAGRCHEHERVPYEGFDGVIDTLAATLVRDPPSPTSLEAGAAAALVTVFPALRRVAGVAEAARDAGDITVDAFAIRRAAFGALAALLAEVARRRGLVVVVDDWQWAGPDAARLASSLRATGLAATWVLASRSPIDALDEGDVTRDDIALGPLDATIAAALVRHSSEAQLDDDAIRGIVADAEGSPLLLGALARTGAAGGPGGVLDRWVAGATAPLGDDARALLWTVALAGVPVPHDVAARATASSPSRLRAAVAQLRRARLVADGGDELRGWIPAHERIGAALVRRCDEVTRRRVHERLAEAFVEEVDDAAAAAVHWHGAGQPQRAVACATAAAARAQRVLAFDRAAAHYRDALAWNDDPSLRSALLEHLGAALAEAGRGRDAAHSFLAAAQDADDARRWVLHRRAAGELLRTGHLDEGRELLRGVLARHGVPLPRLPALAAVLEHTRLLVHAPRGPAHGWQAGALERLDACWAVATGLGFSDMLTSATFVARGTRLALAVGEPTRVARWRGLQAVRAALAGAATPELMAQVRTANAIVDDALARALLQLAEAGVEHTHGRWRAAVTLADAATAKLRALGPAVWWETTCAQIAAESALYWLGELPELTARVDAALADGDARGDLFAVVTRRAGGLGAIGRLAADDPDRAARELDGALARWSQGGVHVQHWYAFQGRVQIALYRRDVAALREWLAVTWPRLERSWVHRAPVMRITGHWRHGCAVLGADGDRSALRRSVEALQDTEHPMAEALVGLLVAGAAAADRDVAGASRSLRDAIARCDAQQMALLAVIARRRLGQLTGGDEGERLRAEADDAMRERGIRRPERFAQALVPWPAP